MPDSAGQNIEMEDENCGKRKQNYLQTQARLPAFTGKHLKRPAIAPNLPSQRYYIHRQTAC